MASAAVAARVKPERVLRLLDEEEFFSVFCAVRSGALGPTAVVLGDESQDGAEAA